MNLFDTTQKIDEYKRAILSSQPTAEDIDTSSDSMTDVEQENQPPALVYIQEFDLDIEQFINTIINDTVNDSDI
jgi:hypothetical protein